MASPVSIQNTHQTSTAAVLETPSLLDKHRDLLSLLVGEKQLSKIQELSDGTVDTVLWERTTMDGPSDYHWSLVEELTKGVVWVQKDRTFGITLHWIENPGWIHSAHVSLRSRFCHR